MPLSSPSNPTPATCISAGPRAGATRQRGLSLVELVLFIAIVGIAISGVLVVYNQAIKGSADPLVRKQAVAIAESLLGEVLMQPFTWCDPQDAANDAATPPASGAACTGGVANSQDRNGGALGPQPATESRLSPTDPFDNVADYHGYTMASGIYSLDNGSTPIAGLGAYSASVAVTRAGATFGLAAGAVLRVDVLVTGRGESITLTGYRFRHSPNATG
jgi:MSHA pilin protein MshD